jgi:hypothetical protein
MVHLDFHPRSRPKLHKSAIVDEAINKAVISHNRISEQSSFRAVHLARARRVQSDRLRSAHRAFREMHTFVLSRLIRTVFELSE